LAEHLHAEPYLRLRYFCSPYHQDSALFPVIDQLGRAAGFARDDMPGSRLEKLEALLARAAPPEEDVAFLADLMSLPGTEHHKLPNLSPQRKKVRTLEALIRQLEGLARRQPVVMVFEDAHWIDPTSRELLDLTVEHVRNLSVLLIVTFRPEFQPRRISDSSVIGNSCQFVEQRLCLSQIGRGEAFGEPAVDRREQVAGFGAAALVAAEPGEAHGGAQLPELGPLLLGDAQGFAIQFLDCLGMPLPQQQLAFVPIELRCEPALACPFDDLTCLL
jgi:hypothetical protein